MAWVAAAPVFAIDWVAAPIIGLAEPPELKFLNVAGGVTDVLLEPPPPHAPSAEAMTAIIEIFEIRVCIVCP